MTFNEAGEIVGIMLIAYPSFHPQNIEATVTIWYDMLKDYEADIAKAALKYFIATSESDFAPSIGKIIKIINSFNNPQTMFPTEDEIISKISKAVSNSSYNSEAEFEKLPPIAQKMIGSPQQLKGYGLIPVAEFHTVVESNLRKAYRSLLSREKDAKDKELAKLTGGITNALIG